MCMGNICRSPTAHGVFQHYIIGGSLQDRVSVDSAGTFAYHAGEKPDPRAMVAAAKRGYDLSKIKARKVEAADLVKFDYIMAMDNDNKRDLLALCEDEDHKAKVKLFLEFAKKSKVKEVPDPYYGGARGFEKVLDLVEEASIGLLRTIKAKHSLRS